MITEDKIVKSMGVHEQNKPLKTSERGTTENNKLVVTRLRKLFNIILQMDENIIQSIMCVENNQIENLVHELKINYIQGGSELVNVF